MACTVLKEWSEAEALQLCVPQQFCGLQACAKLRAQQHALAGLS